MRFLRRANQQRNCTAITIAVRSGERQMHATSLARATRRLRSGAAWPASGADERPRRHGLREAPDHRGGWPPPAARQRASRRPRGVAGKPARCGGAGGRQGALRVDVAVGTDDWVSGRNARQRRLNDFDGRERLAAGESEELARRAPPRTHDGTAAALLRRSRPSGPSHHRVIAHHARVQNDLGGLAPPALRKDLDLRGSRIARRLDPAADFLQLDDAIAHHAAVVEKI
jgi:hypothetical protein